MAARAGASSRWLLPTKTKSAVPLSVFLAFGTALRIYSFATWSYITVKAEKKSSGKSVQKVRHKKFGEVTVVEKKGDFIAVYFASVGKKSLNLKVCQEKGAD